MPAISRKLPSVLLSGGGLGLTGLSGPVHAQPYELGKQLPQMLLSLGLVLVIIFVLAWLSRRFLHFRPQVGNAELKIVAGLSVGPRERIVVVQAGEQQVLVGLTPGRIEALHVFEGAPIEGVQSSSPSFVHALRQTVQRTTDGPSK
ncbi:MAG: flagellar biosynthetic protein FliO [Gammaproteobacteria bacterium]|nr:flagellar biosynthetic protein FliO [Gammaproteobacteria bacterium]